MSMRHPEHKASERKAIYRATPAREPAPPARLGWAPHTEGGGFIDTTLKVTQCV